MQLKHSPELTAQIVVFKLNFHFENINNKKITKANSICKKIIQKQYYHETRTQNEFKNIFLNFALRINWLQTNQSKQNPINIKNYKFLFAILWIAIASMLRITCPALHGKSLTVFVNHGYKIFNEHPKWKKKGWKAEEKKN